MNQYYLNAISDYIKNIAHWVTNKTWTRQRTVCIKKITNENNCMTGQEKCNAG